MTERISEVVEKSEVNAAYKMSHLLADAVAVQRIGGHMRTILVKP